MLGNKRLSEQPDDLSLSLSLSIHIYIYICRYVDARQQQAERAAGRALYTL